jgi:hypothetical protein
MKWDAIIGFTLFLLITVGSASLLYWLVSYLKVNYNEDWFKNLNLKKHLWDNTPMGWMWKRLFGEKKKAKQPGNTYVYNTSNLYASIPPPPPKPRNILSANNLSPYNTSSLNVPPIVNIGKPLVIKNWDRLTGMNMGVLGRNWLVVQAMHTLSGYEAVLACRSTNHTITFCIYENMYDSHRVSVFCKGSIIHLPVNVCKDPKILLEHISFEFANKFDV